MVLVQGKHSEEKLVQDKPETSHYTDSLKLNKTRNCVYEEEDGEFFKSEGKERDQLKPLTQRKGQKEKGEGKKIKDKWEKRFKNRKMVSGEKTKL